MSNDNFNPFDEKAEKETTNQTFNATEPSNEVNVESQTIETGNDDLTSTDVPVESKAVPSEENFLNDYCESPEVNPVVKEDISVVEEKTSKEHIISNPPENFNNIPPVSTPPIYTPPVNPSQETNPNVNESSNYYINNEGYNSALNGKKKNKKNINALVIALVSVCLLGIVAAGIWGIVEINNNNNPSETSSDNVASSNSNNSHVLQGDIPTSGPLTIPQIFAKLKPSVVVIIGDNRSLGSGIVMKEDGTILTNAHVVEGGKSFKIITSDEKTYTDVEVIGFDTQSDLAVLKIKTSDKFTAASFGKTSELVVGQSVVAIGNPYSEDLTYTCTPGIISGIRSNLTLGDFTSDLIQTSAQVNPGNSGGPLIDEYGRVIGIVNLKIMASGNGSSTEGLGFAIPMDVAIPIAETLIKDGYISKPMLGLTGYFVDAAAAQYNSLPVGILIESVSAGSDIEKQNIKKDDVITKINGVAFKSLEEFNSIKAKFKIGDTVTLTVFSNNTFRDVDVKLVDSKSSN